MSTSDHQLPEVIINWVSEINDPNIPIWLRENYAVKLQSLQTFLGTELDKFKRDLQKENRRIRRNEKKWK